jgi:phosphoglycolate phosphatase
MRPRAVLFDLDGTLVDSAPDLIAAVTRVCAEEGAPGPDVTAVRRVVSAGGRAMLRAAFPGIEEAAVERLLPRFLELYSLRIADATRLYDGMDAVLAALEAGAIAWGVVTNKPGWLARPLLARLALDTRAAVLVAGDTLAVRKPDPAPLLHACGIVGVVPGETVYVGDDRRDIDAGRAAGMPTIAAGWGYLDGGDPHAWGADVVAADVPALRRMLAPA